MEVLLLILVLAGLVAAAFGVAFYVRVWRVLGVHGQAMRELHLYLNDQRISARIPPRAPQVPPQQGPHTRWNTPGSPESGQ